MKISGNTVLITGGSDGIGFELARQFLHHGNKVVITGRNKSRLDRARQCLGESRAVQSDVTNPADVAQLVGWIRTEVPDLNVLINNAGVFFGGDIANDEHGFETARVEMLTNYLSAVRLNERLLPMLRARSESAIVNVSSRAAIVPRLDAVGYSVSKAALHTYTMALRLMLEYSTVKVFELMPPAVHTNFGPAGGAKDGISPREVGEALFNAFKADEYEIHVASTQVLYDLFRESPEGALRYINSVK